MKLVEFIRSCFLLTLFLPIGALAQPRDGLDLGSPDIKGAFEPHSIQNADEWMLGGHLGIADVRNQITLTAFLDARPYADKVMVKRRDVHYQFHEWRGMAGFMLEKAFLPWLKGNKRHGFYLEGVAGYSYGNYRGSAIEPKEEWVILPGGGLALGAGKYGYWKLGVQYAPIPGRSDIAPLRFKLAGMLHMRND